jgi:hypothetical protein
MNKSWWTVKKVELEKPEETIAVHLELEEEDKQKIKRRITRSRENFILPLRRRPLQRY